MTAFPAGTILGYPRIGRRRELKKAVEAFWADVPTRLSSSRPPQSCVPSLVTASPRSVSVATTRRFPSRSLTTTRCSTPPSPSAPSRHASKTCAMDGTIGLPAYFTIARGEGDRAPLEMTKWFDSNYHYLVPEIGPDTTFSLSSDRLVREVAEAAEAGFGLRPVVVGPVTLLALAKAADSTPRASTRSPTGRRASGLRRAARPPARCRCRVGADG